MREEIIKMDIIIGYSFITFSIFMLTWGLIKIVEKVAEINYHIDHIKKRLDEYDEKTKQVTAETKWLLSVIISVVMIIMKNQ